MDTCVNGRWESGVCVCNQGYLSGFDENNLKPTYCEREIVAVIDYSDTQSSTVLLDLISITLTIVVFAWGLLGVCSIFATVVYVYQLHKKTTEIKKVSSEFFLAVNTDDSQRPEMKDAAVWEPSDKEFKQLKK